MKKGTSKLPLIMGVIGGSLAIPMAVCSGACVAGLTSITESIDSKTLNNIILGLGLLGGSLGIIGGILGKPLPTKSGILLSIGAVFMTVASVPNIIFQVKHASALNVMQGIQRIAVVINILNIICVILLLLGAIFAFTQKKEEI